MAGPFDLLICDCDGVVIDSEVIADRVLNALVCSAYPGHDVRAALAGYFGLHTRAVLEKLAGLVGEPMAPSFVERVDREIDEALRRDAGVVVGVRDALEQIPLPVAVVSNSRYDWIEFAVAKAGLTSRVGARSSAPRGSRGQSLHRTSISPRRDNWDSRPHAVSWSRIVCRV